MDDTSPNRGLSSDSISTSDDFEDLGQSNKIASLANSQEEKPETFKDLVVTCNKISPEMEIGSNGNIADLQNKLDEALTEDTNTISGMLDNLPPLVYVTYYCLDNPKGVENVEGCTIFSQIAYLGAATVSEE